MSPYLDKRLHSDRYWTRFTHEATPMLGESDKYIAFKNQSDFFKQYYPAYANNIELGLWYGEEVVAEKLVSYLKNRYSVRKEFWGLGNKYISHIVRNVDEHLQRASEGEEKLRLSPADTADKRARDRDPHFFDQVFDRYGDIENVRSFKNEETVSVVSNKDSELLIQRSCYLDQLGSNILCDNKIIDKNTSLRDVEHSDGKFLPFELSSLANTIGVSTLFIDKNGVPLLRYRQNQDTGKRMGIMEEGWHGTASGVLTWEDMIGSPTKHNSTSIGDVMRGIERESGYEAGIWGHEDIYTAIPVSFAREMKRAGKPQFFFIFKFHKHDAKQIVKLISDRYLLEGDEFGFKNLIKLFRPKLSKNVDDFKIDDRLNINTLTRSKLRNLIGTKNGINFTFEGYANLFFSLKS